MCTRRPSGPGWISSISPMICSKRPSLRPVGDLRVPAAAVRRRPLEDAAEELHPLVEVECLEGVDPERLEEAARGVQVLLVRRRVADERDALRADVDRVRPLVDRGDPRADHDVAPVGVVRLRRVGLDDPVGEGGILPRLREHGRIGQRAVAAGEHDVLRAADELRVLVEEDEVRRVAVSGIGALEPADLRVVAVVVPAEPPRDDVRHAQDVRDAGVVLPPGGADQRAEAPARPGLELCERGPVGRQEVRLGLRPQNRLAEVERELLVRLDRVVARPVDRDLLRAEAEVDRGRVDDQRAETVADDCDRRVTRR